MIIEVLGCRLPVNSLPKDQVTSGGNAVASLHLDATMERTEVEKISKALADETRLRIFEGISSTDLMNCAEIVSMRGVTLATVSHHVKILSEAGLIACRREAQFVYSRTVPETIAAYTRATAKIARLGAGTAAIPSKEGKDAYDAGKGHAPQEPRPWTASRE
jgi:ArsR family transcriptional regulator